MVRESNKPFDIERAKDVFDSDDWDVIERELVKFTTSLLYSAFRVHMEERVHIARSSMEGEMDTNSIYRHQGRVLAHKHDIMIFEELLGISRNPNFRRTKDGRSRS